MQIIKMLTSAGQPRYFSRPTPKTTKTVTINPAPTTPAIIAGIDFLNGKFIKVANNAPVQAPVNGKGAAINKANPSASYL